MKPSDIKYLVVHCSATRASADIGAAEITQWHRKQGWRTIGYHFVIRRNGEVELGRPQSEPGAHVSGFNGVSLGICMVGGVGLDGVTGEDNFTSPQRLALHALITRLAKDHPAAKVLGHRDLSPDKNKDGRVTKNEWLKVCPSFDVPAWWAAHRTA
jgi:N-acetyl-anhydromuramyl-L-alanine amidase AmpD